MDRHPKFDQLWEEYPKKVNKWSANKAFSTLIQNEPRIDIDKIILCARIYAKITDPKYYHDLGNWIRNDHWRDLYYLDDLEEESRRFDQRYHLAGQIISHWNLHKPRWWLPIIDKEGKRIALIDAIRYDFFKENWEKAFNALSIVFKRRFPESDYRSRITPNIEWFIQSGRVGQILEGYYGKYRKPKPKYEDKTLNDGITHVQIERDSEQKDPVKLDQEMKNQIDKLLGRKPKNPFL